MSNLKIVSLNVNSFKSKIPIIKKLTENFDIIFLQEIMLLSEDLGLLGDVNDNFCYYAIPSVMSINNVGRPIGGLAVIFNKKLTPFIKINCISINIMNVELSFRN